MSRRAKHDKFMRAAARWHDAVTTLAAEIFPALPGGRNYWNHDEDRVTVTQVGHYPFDRREIGCFAAPPRPVYPE